MLADGAPIGYPRRRAAHGGLGRVLGMNGRYGLVYPLWCYAGGQDDLLDRALGEVGADFCTLPLVTGPLSRLTPWTERSTAMFQTRGGWHAPLHAQRATTVLKRIRQASWFGKRDILAKVLDVLRTRRLPAGARIDLRAAAALAPHGEHLAAINAWGDADPSAGACVLNDEVRELLRATLECVADLGFAGYQTVDWCVDCAANRHTGRALDWHPTVRRLLDICFCAACRQAAAEDDIDPDQVARSVRVHAERGLLNPEHDLAAAVAADELLTRYWGARTNRNDAWLDRLAAQHTTLRATHVCDTEFFGEPASLYQRVEPLARIHEPLPEKNADATPFWHPAKALTLPAWRPMFTHADDLVRFVLEAQHAGVARFEFEDLDAAPDEAITWVRQAVRFARRE